MKRISIVGLALCMLLLGSMATPSIADTLWYNGDWYLDYNNPPDDQANRSVSNQISLTLTARTYDDFVVPAGGWTINTLYSNIVNPYSTDAFTITGVSYEIRQEMVGTHDPPYQGDGGTLISSDSSGSSANFTVTPTGRYSGDGISQTYSEQTVAVTGLNFFLPAGTYWLSVTPKVPEGSGELSSTVTIGGDTAIGFLPGNGLFCFSGADPPVLYADGYYVSSGPIDYSMGIDGTTGSSVPIPPSILLLASGLLALSVHGFRARKR